jgi:hypothetical protein
MRKIITPRLMDRNGPKFEISRDLNGGMVFRINSEAVHLTPREAYDAAIVMLKQVGAVFQEVPKFPGDLGGPAMMAAMKMKFGNQ